jgi:hypothetical protein
MAYRRATPDKIDVAFEYEVAGIRYENRFVVLYPSADRYWAGLTTNQAVGEKVMIRYDPENPLDSLLAEKMWHGWRVWTLGSLLSRSRPNDLISRGDSAVAVL